MSAQILPFALLSETGEDMKLREEDKKELAEEIAKQIEAALVRVVDSLKPHGFRRVTFWLKEWGAISALWAVPLSLLAAVIALGLFAVNHVSSNAIFQSKATSDIGHLQEDVKGIKAALTRQEVISQASLPQAAFAASLSELKDSLAKVREQDTPISRGVIAEVQEKLIATDTTAPSYWPATSEFINFREAAYHPAVRPSLPRCVSSGPSPSITETANDPNHVLVLPAFFENCRVRIDAPDEMERIGQPVGGTIIFEHCVVEYGGGDIAAYHVNLRFNDCQWQMSIPTVPPLRGRTITQQVLAMNAVSLPSLG